MNQQKHIFTIMAGCVPVGIKMLESYLKFHTEKLNVYLFSSDFPLGLEINVNKLHIVIHFLSDDLKEDFKQGHLGTAKVWAQIVKENPESYLIHIDSDVIFKKESLSLIEKAGYPDIYGSRRCYKNNPANIPVPDGVEDAISTYFVGINAKVIHTMMYDDHVLVKMFQGAWNPLDFPVFDFFDPIFFHMRSNGASVYYEDSYIIGGQNEYGSKSNFYESNLHLDMGLHLAHFGGVGSGYQATIDDSQMNKSYSEWAKYRWKLFDCLLNHYTFSHYKELYNEEKQTKINDDGRWVDGPADIDIYVQIREDLDN